MRIRLLAVGRRMPAWVTSAYDDYAKRLPHECRLELTEIAPGNRKGQSHKPERAIADEDRRICDALSGDQDVIALAIDGKPWTTEQLAAQMREWLADGRDRALLVGGPDGLGPNSLARAHRRWSLSPLTLPHPLVRVILAEQLFRAHSILTGHPYHRG
ncbi:Ribosomal RNA large subunit methyltransferase H protein [Salinisphaera shabanensis E1L3A]|uniref:Ribosomal RNA large subunit methyltransferase H n=1 Tax=Salinisphaera shabanensis E1L3A TaxID=1033802 RepID=U2EMZ3_9GAMM|nr:23S rRNA (pseudouridine(1915)-N(3))-methyltransferase RlmH [Salinisphaera shabanensis]ERJ19225.1 Ribosomal RNA large subunit methyltransferase H protein [Salinisphaera shabanensis E1L3A]